MRTATRRLGALAGLVAAAVALGVAELLAAFVGPSSSPLTAVAGEIVDRLPRSAEQFGVQTFGHWDKPLLTAIVLVVLAGVAALAGILAVRRIGFGLGVIALFAVIGGLATYARPDSTSVAIVPTLVGAVVAMGTLPALIRRAQGAVTAATDDAEVADSQRTAEPAGVGGTAGSAPGSSSTEFDFAGAGDATRRRFLLFAGGAAGAAVVAGGTGRLVSKWRGVGDRRAAIRLPAASSPAPAVPAGAELNVPGLTPLLTPNGSFYRVDTAFVLPQVDPDGWRLRIHGRARRELTLTYADLLKRPLIERDVTLTCVSNDVGGNLIGSARWLGVRLADLLAEVEPDEDADQLVGRSADGWTCGTPTAACRDGRDALLAVGMNGKPLPVAHGFPVRMVVPGLYGYVSATKWLVDLELSRFSDFDAYWVPRGWSQQAPIKTSSRIDTPHQSGKVDAGRVVVAGVAWAQHRGIAKVEVRVDEGAWQEATLAAADSVDTWRQWRWDWDAKAAGSGRHTLEVRATDTTGIPQSGTSAAPAPNGSEGWHHISVVVR